MRAAVYDEYGGPDRIRLEDRPVPEPTGSRLRIRVVATSINLSDWETLRGSPAYARIGGLRSPAQPVLGSDIAGVVDAVGPEVSRFEVGDAVYADNLGLKGGFAQYAIASESACALKPPELSFVDASTIPQAGAIALRGTRSMAAGKRVLINGAGGGSGMFAIQLAKRAGTHLTAVDNGAKLDFMRSLGADEVIDYATTDFTATDDGYDHILDMVAHRSVFAYRRALRPGGSYRMVGGTMRSILRAATVGALVARATGRSIGVLRVDEGPEHFEPLTDLILGGDVDIHIDRVVALDEVAEALAHHGEGRALGKVVVRVADDPTDPTD